MNDFVYVIFASSENKASLKCLPKLVGVMKRIVLRSLVLILVVCALYALGRLYYRLTGGFVISNITSDFPHQPQWEVRPLHTDEKNEFLHALAQPYHYLGKGCQSYVFESQDGQYVIKFFKYQRYRLQSWLAYFPPLPAVVKYSQEKVRESGENSTDLLGAGNSPLKTLKRRSASYLSISNKTSHLKKNLLLYDKIGQPHTVELDQMEFCIQRKAVLLCQTLLEYKEKEVRCFTQFD